MAHTRKDTLTEPPEWWKHMRPFGKRQISKAERRASRRQILEDMEPDETPEGLGLHNPESTMRKLKFEKGESVIPIGGYCYGKDGNCPYWDMAEHKEKQNNGFCWFLGKGDWFEDQSVDLLWDQCKMCGKNEPDGNAPEGTISVWDEKDFK